MSNPNVPQPPFPPMPKLDVRTGKEYTPLSASKLFDLWKEANPEGPEKRHWSDLAPAEWTAWLNFAKAVRDYTRAPL